MFNLFEAVILRGYLALVRRTSSFDIVELLPLIDELEHGLSVVIAVWHRELFLFLPLHYHLKKVVHVLVTDHQGADKFASLLRQVRIQVLRPASVFAIREQLLIAKRLLVKPGNIVVLAVDGPFGPNGVAKRGASLLAKMSGVPIIPIHCETRRYWLGDTWDSRIYPRLNNHFMYRVGNRIYVSGPGNGPTLDNATKALQAELDSIASRTK